MSYLDAMYCFGGLFVVVLVCMDRRGFGVIGGWLIPSMRIDILIHLTLCSIDQPEPLSKSAWSILLMCGPIVTSTSSLIFPQSQLPRIIMSNYLRKELTFVHGSPHALTRVKHETL